MDRTVAELTDQLTNILEGKDDTDPMVLGNAFFELFPEERWPGITDEEIRQIGEEVLLIREIVLLERSSPLLGKGGRS